MNWLSIATLLLVTTLIACAQRGAVLVQPLAAPKMASSEPEKVYTYAEQMPQLLSGGGQQRIGMELMKRFSYPAFSHSDQWPASNVKVAFVVNTDGSLQDVKLLVSSHNTTIDNALLAAAYAMPCLLPGYQNGRPVRVQLMFPIGLEYR
jgi:TonB family protein